MVARLAAIRFVREALAEKADLKALRAKPTPRVWFGLGLVALSYIIGWPAVGLLAWISYHLREPLIVAIGGPIAYGLSHLVFMAGSCLAGSLYARTLLRWATRRLVERLTGEAAPEQAPPSFLLSRLPGGGGDSQGNDVAEHAPGEGIAHASRTVNVPVVGCRPERALFPALITGTVAFLLAGLLLFIRPTLAAVPLGCFILLCLVAPFMPGAGFFLPVVHRRKSGRRAVSLTFDDGPDPDVTPRLLELLELHGVTATFFVAGAAAQQHPELIRDILFRGHTLGNHSYHHDPLLMLRSRATLREEVARTQDLLAAFAIRPLTFRPPVGITNPRIDGVLREFGMYCVTFSCRAFDRGNRRIAGLAEIILKKVRPGDIILLHDVAPRGGGTVDQWIVEMERIVSGLKGQRYELLPLSELIERPVMECIVCDESPE